MRDHSLISRMDVIDVRQVKCTDEECTTPDEPVVALVLYVSNDGSAEGEHHGCCAGCLVKTMDRIEAAPALMRIVHANFDADYIARLRGDIS